MNSIPSAPPGEGPENLNSKARKASVDTEEERKEGEENVGVTAG
jgi:hypothetical protein